MTLSNLRHAPPPLSPQAFCLTEYGYNTRTRLDFGGFTVTEANQAKHLRRAYALAGCYRQVKALFWFLVWDGLYATRRAKRSPGWL